MDRSNYRDESGVDTVLGEVDAALGETVATCLLGYTGASSVESDRWLTSLRVLLETSNASMTAPVAARLLGVSTRTMQRYLRSVGTTFRQEVEAVRGTPRAAS
jgi:hypothetical protein